MLARETRVNAADSVTYSVTIAPSGNDAVDQAVHDAATLVSLRGDGPDAGRLEPVGLLARARTDASRFAAALNSLGHYAGTATITVAGRALDDPALADALQALPNQADVPVAVAIKPGPVFQLRHVTVSGDAAGEQISLRPGDPAVASAVLAAGARLQERLLASGHAFAQVDEPVADLDAADHAVDVTFNVHAGPRLDIGEITVQGEQRLHEDYIRRRLTLAQGSQFDPAKLEAARADLARVPALASVRLVPGTAVDAYGRLPVTVQVTERPLHEVTVGAAFSTDQGANATVTWTHRNLFGEAELLALSAAVTDIGAGAATQPGYRVGAALTVPDWRARDQSLDFTALAVRESLDAYDRTALLAGAAFGMRLADHLRGSIGVAAERASITQNKVTREYTLLQAPITLRYDTTDSQTLPTRGLRAEAFLTPTLSLARLNSTFAIAQLTASTYFDLAAPGRDVLALRGLVGTVSGAGTFDIPPDQRFYAGGSGTIRGYRYQSVGPRLSNSKPSGGTALVAGTVELRHRIGASWGVAGFVDGGEVGGTKLPGDTGSLGGKFRLGVGFGVRYYTSIGPIRFDVAAPVGRPKGGDIGEIYIGLGEAF